MNIPDTKDQAEIMTLAICRECAWLFRVGPVGMCPACHSRYIELARDERVGMSHSMGTPESHSMPKSESFPALPIILAGLILTAALVIPRCS